MTCIHRQCERQGNTEFPFVDVRCGAAAAAQGRGCLFLQLVSRVTKAPRVPHHDSSTDCAGRGRRAFLGYASALSAIGIPGGLILALLGLPFYDRNRNRSMRSRPVAALCLAAVLGSTAPLLGASLREDSVGVIAPEAGRALTSVERAGRSLFKAQHCGGCHQVGNQKVKKTDDTPDAPVLSAVGLKHSSSWMHSFMEDPMKFHPDSKMPAYGPPKLSHQEIEELARYLSTLRGSLEKKP